MQVINSHEVLQTSLLPLKQNKNKTGFIPTMGALHKGHMSLIERAALENEVTIASIFVNPTQFNDAGDLANYPRTPEADYKLLESYGCDFVFTPSVTEMYPDNFDSIDLDFGNLSKGMEGKFRKGHFQGMATIVYKLLSMVEPTHAYFGEKDFQQLAIIRFMVNKLAMPIHIIGCPIIREPDGLAMSSRNIHLTPDERVEAPIIFNSMKRFTALHTTLSVQETIHKVIHEIEKSGLFQVEYFELVHADTLESISGWNQTPEIRACIAVKTSKTRLIDNIAVRFAERS